MRASECRFPKRQWEPSSSHRILKAAWHRTGCLRCPIRDRAVSRQACFRRRDRLSPRGCAGKASAHLDRRIKREECCALLFGELGMLGNKFLLLCLIFLRGHTWTLWALVLLLGYAGKAYKAYKKGGEIPFHNLMLYVNRNRLLSSMSIVHIRCIATMT